MDKQNFLNTFKGVPLRCKECKKDYKDASNKMMIGASKGTCINCLEEKEKRLNEIL